MRESRYLPQRLAAGLFALAAGLLVDTAWSDTRPPARAADPPRVASINLCADQLVLALADREQILTVSWLAADPHESMLADRAAGVPPNYGTAEELLRYQPDVVIAGAFTGDFTRALLRRLGFHVVDMMPADSMAEVERDIRLVGEAIGQRARAEAMIEAMNARIRALERTRPPAPVDAVVVRPGGFTVGRGTLAHELMELAGLRNVAAEHGLDRWGSLSMETLLTAAPELIILTGYRDHEPSLAHAVLEHPALARMKARVATVTVPAAAWACGLPESLRSAALIREHLAPPAEASP